MADEPKSKPAGSLTKEEHRQLLVHHMSGLRTKAAEIKELREPLTTAQDEFTALINTAKADLGKGYTRKYLLTLLEDATTRLRDLAAEEDRRARDREALGLPVFGVQADLFGESAAAMPDEARDELHWEAEGYMRGRNGLLQEIPDGTPPRFHPTVLKGYGRGQQATLDDKLAAAELIAKRGQPDPDAAPKDLNGEAQADPMDPAAIKAAADKLKASDFMDTGEGAKASEPATPAARRAAKQAESVGAMAGAH